MVIPFACLVWIQSSKYQEIKAKIKFEVKILKEKFRGNGCKYLFLNVSIKQKLTFKKNRIENLLYMELLPIL